MPIHTLDILIMNGKTQNFVHRAMIIEVKPRLHITLIGMNKDGYRINGGVGFTVQRPSLKIKLCQSKRFNLVDSRNYPFSAKEIARIKNIISQEKERLGFRNNIKGEIAGEMPTHFGFGSSTATRLACLEALHILNDKKPKKEQLVIASGRGGTSGIGINTYFKGGFVIDLGRRTKEFS